MVRQLDPSAELQFGEGGDLLRLWFSKPMGCTQDGLSGATSWIGDVLWPPLMDLTGAGSEDWFNWGVDPLGLSSMTQGYRLTLDRVWKGVPVTHDTIRVYLAFTDGPSFEPHPHADGRLDLSLREPGSEEPLCVVGVESSLTRDLGPIVSDVEPVLDSLDAHGIAVIATGVPADHEETHLVVWKKLGVPYLAWRVVLYRHGVYEAMVVVDARTGEILHDQRPAAFKIWTQASNPHEPYTDGQAKTFKPFPYVDAYSSWETVPCQGAPAGAIKRGRLTDHLGTTDYHGNPDFLDPGDPIYLDHRFQSPPGLRDMDQVASLHVDYCPSTDPTADHCGWCKKDNSGNSSWVDCQKAECDGYVNTYYYFNTVRSQGELKTYWWPVDSTFPCDEAHVVQVRQHVGASSRQGRRKEILYHGAIAQYWWNDWLGVALPGTEVRVAQNFAFDRWAVRQPLCGAGTTFSAGTVQIGCDLCSFEQKNLTYLGESKSRSTVYHEFGHVADHAMHDYFSYHEIPFDLPLNNEGGKSLTEGIAIFSAGAVGSFDQFHFSGLYGSPIDTDLYRTYPYGYVCGCGGSCLYNRAFLWINVWFDFLFMTGLPVAVPVLADHIGDSAFLGQLWLLDRGCVDTFDYDICQSGAYGETYYGRMFDSAIAVWTADYHLTYEATKAWQTRIVDWDPGYLSPGDCDGVNPVRDPLDPNRYDDFAPWFDDVTNVTWFAPYLPIDTQGEQVYFEGYGYGLKHGPFGEASATCRSRDSGAQCKDLAIDYSSDRDKFILLGRGGRQYFIYTTAGPGSSAGTDTILEVRSAEDQVLLDNDDCEDPEMPPFGTLYSCLRFTSSAASPYRLVVRGYPGSASGSRARYRLVVETRGDDYPNFQQDASPAPEGWVFGWANSSRDRDWFYQTMLSPGEMGLLVWPGSQNPVEVWVIDHTGTNVLGPLSVESLQYFPLGTWPTGTYYLRVRMSPDCTTCDQTSYAFDWFNSSAAGGGQDDAVTIGDPDVPTPLPSIAYTSRIDQVGGKHYYRKTAQRGEICIVDAHASLGQVVLKVERDTRASTPIHQRIAQEAGADSWQSLVEDRHGGMVAEGRAKANAHLTFVAPWEGDYFFVVEAAEAPASYTLWVGCGVAWTNVPEVP